jgi:uncharacterized protein (DUF1697 family)
MNTFVLLLRGINVGGKNKISMAELKRCLEEQGFQNVTTYIQSGNVILRSNLDAAVLSAKIEGVLPKKFKLDSPTVRVAALDYRTYEKLVTQAPQEFVQDDPSYRYNVIFLININPREAMAQIDARQGVDQVWQGANAIYHRYLKQNASKSHISKITQQPVYQSITIRNWNTTRKLLELLQKLK